MNFLAKFAFAQETVSNVATLVERITKVIVNPLIIFLFALALVYFLWGVVEFIAGSANEEKRSTGRRHMIWGLVGMLIMMGVFAIMQIIINTLGINLGGATPSGGEVNVQ